MNGSAPGEDYEIEYREDIDAGDAVVTRLPAGWTGKGSGIRSERDFFGVWNLRGLEGRPLPSVRVARASLRSRRALGVVLWTKSRSQEPLRVRTKKLKGTATGRKTFANSSTWRPSSATPTCLRGFDGPSWLHGFHLIVQPSASVSDGRAPVRPAPRLARREARPRPAMDRRSRRPERLGSAAANLSRARIHAASALRPTRERSAGSRHIGRDAASRPLAGPVRPLPRTSRPGIARDRSS